MNEAQKKAVQTVILNKLEDIKRKALLLRHRTCGYSHPDPFNKGKLSDGRMGYVQTVAGKDGKPQKDEKGHVLLKAADENWDYETWRCDCKFCDPHAGFRTGEQTGCAEALTIMMLVNELKELVK